MDCNIEDSKCCSFFGHRKINISKELKQKVYEVIKSLIEVYNVSTFLFGGHSDFDTLCLSIVENLKIKHPHIKRIAYTCKNETCTLEKERTKWEKIYSHFQQKDVHLFCVDEEFEHKTKYTAGKSSYIQRNYSMIDNSDFCVFYYDKTYKPPSRKISKKNLCTYQPNSGTHLAYNYASKKNKNIINIKNLL